MEQLAELEGKAGVIHWFRCPPAFTRQVTCFFQRETKAALQEVIWRGVNKGVLGIFTFVVFKF